MFFLIHDLFHVVFMTIRIDMGIPVTSWIWMGSRFKQRVKLESLFGGPGASLAGSWSSRVGFPLSFMVDRNLRRCKFLETREWWRFCHQNFTNSPRSLIKSLKCWACALTLYAFSKFVVPRFLPTWHTCFLRALRPISPIKSHGQHANLFIVEGIPFTSIG